VADILIITPGPRHSRNGNRVTAVRWSKILRALGHSVRIAENYERGSADLLVALHAFKSSTAVRRFACQHPNRPIVLALTGTDLYSDIHTKQSAQHSLGLATRLLLLEPNGVDQLPEHLRERVQVIYQSAEPPRHPSPPLSRVFEACLAAHLRAVKDPLRAAMAARRLPVDSSIRVTHVGGALTPAYERRAQQETDTNPRYRWLGEQPHWRARRLIARSRLLVLTSKTEGAPSVISEALAADTPIVATCIPSTRGLLGDDYSGFFEVGDTRALASLMRQCEIDPRFYKQLRAECRQRSRLVKPAREIACWRKLIQETTQ